LSQGILLDAFPRERRDERGHFVQREGCQDPAVGADALAHLEAEVAGHERRRAGRDVEAVEVVAALARYDWPGNVRELENAIQRAITLSQGDKIFPDALPPQIFRPGHGVSISFENFLEEKLADLVDRMGGLDRGDIYSMVLQRVEKPLITLVLKKTDGNQVRAANLLGINRNTLRKKIKELGIKAHFPESEEEGDEENE